MSFVSVHCTISKNLRFFVSNFRPSQSLFVIVRNVKYLKIEKFFQIEQRTNIQTITLQNYQYRNKKDDKLLVSSKKGLLLYH